MKPALRFACLAMLPLALAACQQDKKAASKGTAEGEILPGSASDAMLPYDTVRSQPPLAPMPVATGKAGAKPRTAGDQSAEPADAGASEAPNDAAPAPAATP